MRLLWIILLVIFALLQQRLWFGNNSIRDVLDTQQQISDQTETNQRLQQRNTLMYAEIHDLRNGNEAIEERARNELGMIKQGETFYRVLESRNQTDNE
jgi:cell division protein FtsB